MKCPELMAAILVAAGAVARARDSQAADVIVYVIEASGPPSPVDYGARATVTWIFARIGIRLAWRDGQACAGAGSAGPVVIQVFFAGESPGKASPAKPQSLAYALPFGDGRTAITVMYGRVRAVAGRSSREQPILAHVLAHEIGHILQGANAHAQAGIMKAHWSGQDYAQMEMKPLDFTPVDVELIKDGLNKRKARGRTQYPLQATPPITYFPPASARTRYPLPRRSGIVSRPASRSKARC